MICCLLGTALVKLHSYLATGNAVSLTRDMRLFIFAGRASYHSEMKAD